MEICSGGIGLGCSCRKTDGQASRHGALTPLPQVWNLGAELASADVYTLFENQVQVSVKR